MNMPRRLVLLLAVAGLVVTMLVATAGPALAQAKPNGNNCVGSNQSGNVAGKGGLPGSKANPAPGFTDPVTGGPTWNGPVTSFVAQQPPSALGNFGIPVTPDVAAKPNGISGFQVFAKDQCGR